MSTLWAISHVLLWTMTIGLGFLLLGTLRALGLAQWRLDQLEATRPSRINRDGLKPGRKAPRFTLPRVGGGECSLDEYAGSRVLLAFVQANCGPCHEIVPELNRLQRSGEIRVLAINRAEPEEAARWAAEVRADFPVLVQDGLEMSKKYEVFATPFAFVIHEQGAIAASGIVNSRQHVRFLLDAAAEHTASQGPSDGHGDRLEAADDLSRLRDTKDAFKPAGV